MALVTWALLGLQVGVIQLRLLFPLLFFLHPLVVDFQVFLQLIVRVFIPLFLVLLELLQVCLLVAVREEGVSQDPTVLPRTMLLEVEHDVMEVRLEQRWERVCEPQVEADLEKGAGHNY